jgi:hypothetical protein
MKTYRIFTNDRNPKNGVPMYSALCREDAITPEEAAARHPRWGPPEFGPVKAIEWPVTTQESKDWLEKHVGKGI